MIISVHLLLQIVLIIELIACVVAWGVLIHKLLQHGNQLTRAFISRYHVGAEQTDDLRVGHLLIIEGVDLVQQLLHFDVVFQHAHREDQRAEITLVQHTILVQVKSLEVLVEFQEETLMLFELEIQHDLLKVRILMLLEHFVSRQNPLVNFVPR